MKKQTKRSGGFYWLRIVILLFLILCVLTGICIITVHFFRAISNPNVPVAAQAAPSPTEKAEEVGTGMENTESQTSDNAKPDLLQFFFKSRQTYDPDKYIREDGWIRYDDPAAKTGIDVSAYQEAIDWTQVADAGVEFAMIRVGYRGSTSGGLYADSFFTANIEGAIANGIAVGIYFFSQAINPDEAIAEADFVLDAIESYDISFPIAFDWEHPEDEEARSNNVSSETLNACAAAFCDTIQAAGYTPAVYVNTVQAYLTYAATVLSAYDVWLASYSELPSFYGDYQMWQYSNAGNVPGINGAVDLNISFYDYREQKK